MASDDARGWHRSVQRFSISARPSSKAAPKHNIGRYTYPFWNTSGSNDRVGVQRSRPVLKGTRMPADDIVENWEAGVDEPDIATNFRLSIEQVKAILAYAATHQD